MRSLYVLALLLVTPLVAGEGFPADVTEFLNRRGLCEHFRQEPVPEGGSNEEIERRTFIASKIDQFCTGLNEAEANLRHKYRSQRAVINRLEEHSGFE
jgi:hypothetical protein